MSVLSAKYMHDEAAAFAHVEAMLWADGPVCPHCGVVDSAYKLEGVRTKAKQEEPRGQRTPRPVEVPRVPQAIHRAQRHDL